MVWLNIKEVTEASATGLIYLQKWCRRVGRCSAWTMGGKEHQKQNVVIVSMVVSRGYRQKKIGDPEPPFHSILVEEVWGREELNKLI